MRIAPANSVLCDVLNRVKPHHFTSFLIISPHFVSFRIERHSGGCAILCYAHDGYKNRFTHFLNAVVMKHLFQFLPVFLAMFFTVPSFGQFQDRFTTSPAADNDYTTDMTRTARIGVGFATNNDYDDALGTANRARLAIS